MEAALRLYELPICGRSHSVERLAVRTKNQQKIVFEENKDIQALNKYKTTLTARFDLNKKDEFTRKVKYSNILKYYDFNKDKIWVRRIRTQRYPTIGRLGVVHPKDSERYHLKLILNRIKCAASFEDLRTYKRHTYDTYRDTTIAMELVNNDMFIYKTFDEACTIMMPFQLCDYLATY